MSSVVVESTISGLVVTEFANKNDVFSMYDPSDSQWTYLDEFPADFNAMNVGELVVMNAQRLRLSVTYALVV